MRTIFSWFEDWSRKERELLTLKMPKVGVSFHSSEAVRVVLGRTKKSTDLVWRTELPKRFETVRFTENFVAALPEPAISAAVRILPLDR